MILLALAWSGSRLGTELNHSPILVYSSNRVIYQAFAMDRMRYVSEKRTFNTFVPLNQRRQKDESMRQQRFYEEPAKFPNTKTMPIVPQ